ncbi:MAG: hypoxanthine phosphoribosyltransferase [Deltaproteobacteria bacterium]|nr:hypoxanthine phosphoribosyltransferase [Candidatus Zymogenaceae bacterium]
MYERKEMVFSADSISDAVNRLARRINDDYRDKKLLVVGVLKGCFIFMADLVRKLNMDVELDFVVLRSYGASSTSSGEVEVIKDLEDPIDGRHVLIVEDIVDTGITLRYFRDQLRLRGPASVKICALIDKKARREVDIDVDYVGLEMQEGFVVGYGLDCNEYGRHFPDVWIIEEKGE